MSYTFTFTDQEINTIANSLASLPYGQVYQLINSIQAQVASQVNQKSSDPTEVSVEE